MEPFVLHGTLFSVDKPPQRLNPNNCETCKHKSHPDGGWCYMFRREPTEVCMQHTGRR
jgi:hypothetical protein